MADHARLACPYFKSQYASRYPNPPGFGLYTRNSYSPGDPVEQFVDGVAAKFSLGRYNPGYQILGEMNSVESPSDFPGEPPEFPELPIVNNKNTVIPWNRQQGYLRASDEISVARRNIDLRRISVESSADKSYVIRITTDPIVTPGKLPNPPEVQSTGPLREPWGCIPKEFVLHPRQTKDLGINMLGEPGQFLHILDPYTFLNVGNSQEIRTDCSSFVLRQGEAAAWFQPFLRAGLRA